MENTISRIIAELFEKYRSNDDGALADYIPELTRADPGWFGISIVTADGHQYLIGDTDKKFTIQSISKAFTYGMILDEHGSEKVSARIGVEPSGEAFNSISLDPVTGRPLNPMINAGAIAASGMVTGKGLDDRFEKIRAHFSRYAGNELTLDESVYRSESSTGFRNRAIANLLRNFEKLDDPVDESVELYFQQCSIQVTCADLAMMAGSLANAGVNPVSGERVLGAENVERVLSVMSTCGMYDYSGEWIFNVGLPAKSGVGGGIVGVLPGQMGVAVFSPKLDAKGNSVRGVQVFRDISQRFNLHLFNSPVISDYCIRRIYHLNEAGSHRQRIASHHDAIREHGGSVVIIEMQGDIFFSAIERLIRAKTAESETATTFVIDLKRAGLIDHATEKLIARVGSELAAEGKNLVFIDPNNLLKREDFADISDSVIFEKEIYEALEHCEDRIIAEHTEAAMISGLVPFHDFDLFESLTPQELTKVEGLLQMESYTAGETIVTQGSPPDNILLLAKGSVSIYHQVEGTGVQNARQRIVAFYPGVCFGELGAIDGRPRSADVVTDVASTCYQLPIEEVKKLESDDISIYAKIMRNILQINVDRLRRSNQEIAALKE